MSVSRTTKTAFAMFIFGAIAVAAYALWPERNFLARHRVQKILLSGASVEEQLAALQPYVQLGDSYRSVAERLHPRPYGTREFDRPTHHALALQGVNLELAIRVDGRVAGIGRHIHGKDDGEVWLAGHGDNWWRLADADPN